MADMALVGVERCGCITAALVERNAGRASIREFYSNMADTRLEVRRMDLEEAKQSPNFLGCPHRRSSDCVPSPVAQRDQDAQELREMLTEEETQVRELGGRVKELEDLIADFFLGVRDADELQKAVA